MRRNVEIFYILWTNDNGRIEGCSRHTARARTQFGRPRALLPRSTLPCLCLLWCNSETVRIRQNKHRGHKVSKCESRFEWETEQSSTFNRQKCRKPLFGCELCQKIFVHIFVDVRRSILPLSSFELHQFIVMMLMRQTISVASQEDNRHSNRRSSMLLLTTTANPS